MLNFIVSTETPSDLTHDSRLIDSFDSLILYTHINRTAVSREKYSMILFFLFTPSPALNIILGHPRSSHSESLSLVLKLFSVLFETYIGDSWNSLVSYRLQSWNFTLGALRLSFFWENFCPHKGTPQQPNWTNFVSNQLFQNQCTENHSPKNSRQHIFPNVRGHGQGQKRERLRSSVDRRLTCLLFDSQLVISAVRLLARVLYSL